MKLYRIDFLTGLTPTLNTYIALRYDRGQKTPRYYAENSGLVLGVHTQAVASVETHTTESFRIAYGMIRRSTDRDTPWLIHPEREPTDFCALMVEYQERRLQCESPSGLDPLVRHIGDGLMHNRVTSIWSMNPTSSLRFVFDRTNYLVTNHRGTLDIEVLSRWEDSKHARPVPASTRRLHARGIEAAHKRFV